ncbi:MAG: AraC family transcriptional regulator [Bacteroidetes bacterium]|nr:AraC family transcriptional regulator [Bacteroidota bacterium]
MEAIKLKSFLSGDDYYYIHRDAPSVHGSPGIHRHSFCEVFWIEKGTGIHLLNGTRYPLKKNHLCIIRSFDSHTFYSKSGLQLVNIAFPNESLESLSQRYNYRFTDRHLSSLQWVLPDNLFDQINDLLSKLLSRENTKFNLELFLMNLFSALEETNKDILQTKEKPESKTSAPAWIQDFFNLLTVEKNLSLPIESLSDMIGFSREHLSRQIKKYYKTTPSQLITEARVRFAKKQLTMTSVSILDIALSCGFSSLSQFYKIFKSATGFTPSAFRKNKP